MTVAVMTSCHPGGGERQYVRGSPKLVGHIIWNHLLYTVCACSFVSIHLLETERYFPR